MRASLSPEAQSIIRRLGVTDAALQAVARAWTEENEYTISHIRAKYLSFPKHGPTVAFGLRTQSNRLRDSVNAFPAQISGTTVTTAIGSNVIYAAIHEFGGTTKPHVIRARRRKTLAFAIGGRMLYRRSVNHPGSKIPARAPFSRGINDRLNEYAKEASRALIETWEKS